MGRFQEWPGEESSPMASTETREAAAALEEGLHQDGRRLTSQRRCVLSLFEQLGPGCHLSAEDVHQQLLQAKLRVSLATVYRTLHLLVEMGFLHELELNESGRRFELIRENHPGHHHLVCQRCGRTEEFESDPVLQACQTAADSFGFRLLGTALNVRGLCPACILTDRKISAL